MLRIGKKKNDRLGFGQKGEFSVVDVCQGFHGKYLHVFWPSYIMNIEKRKSFC